MKIYWITSPEKLKEVVPLMKWQKEKDKVAAFAKEWSKTSRKDPDKAKNFFACIQIGRRAEVFKSTGGRSTLLGVMNLSMARTFVTGLINKEGAK